MKGTICYAVVTVLLGLLSGCGGDDSENSNSSSISVPLNSSYNGSWASSLASDRGSLTATLRQNGNDVSGKLTFTGSPCFATGNVDGHISGNQVDAEIDFGGGQSADIQGTVNNSGSNIQGNYTIDGGRCDNDRGTFSLTSGTNAGGSGGGGSPPPSSCCRVCTTGKACGDTCIAATSTCHTPSGCACNG